MYEYTKKFWTLILQKFLFPSFFLSFCLLILLLLFYHPFLPLLPLNVLLLLHISVSPPFSANMCPRSSKCHTRMPELPAYRLRRSKKSISQALVERERKKNTWKSAWKLPSLPATVVERRKLIHARELSRSKVGSRKENLQNILAHIYLYLLPGYTYLYCRQKTFKFP